MRLFTRVAAPVLAVLLAVGCKANDPTSGDGDGDGEADAGPNGGLTPPRVDSYPESTPLGTVAIRGATEGTRVVAQNTAEGSLVAAVLPGGDFCFDAALQPAGTPTEMQLYSIGGDGRVSDPLPVTVTRDEAAPSPSDPNCSGTGGPTCDGPEICGNDGVDDDCNGRADECDNACNGCIDDGFEPNDIALDVPMIEPGTYTMQICPCRDDWFAYQRDANQSIRVTATFDDTAININLKLYKAAPGGFGEGDQVASSFSGTGVESIDFTVIEAGLYYLHVDSPSQDARGSYTFDTN